MKKLLTAFILLSSGIWFLKLWYFGELDFYILPRFNILVIISGLFLCVFGIVLLFVKNNWHQVQDHVQLSTLIPFFALILFFSFSDPKPLSSQSVMKRGLDTNLSQIKLTTPINFEIDSKNRTFADWIKIISTSQTPTQYAGEATNITGFVYRDETSNPDEFYLARFMIRCCSADARPVVLRVKSTDAPLFKNDQWLSIKGFLATDNDSNQPLYIDLKNSTEINAPETPYIY